MAGLAALQGAVSGLSGMLNNIGSGFKAIGELVSKFIDNVKEKVKAVKDAFSDAWEWVKEKWQEKVVEPLQPFFDWIGEKLAAIGELFSDTWAYVKEQWSNFVEDPIGTWVDWWLGIIDFVKEKWSAGMAAIGDAAGGVWDWMKEKASAFGDWVGGIFESVGEFWNTWVTTPIGNAWDWLKGKGSDFGDWIGGIWESIGNLWTTYITEPIGGMWDWVMDKAAEFGEFVWGILEPIVDALSTVTDGIGNFVGGATDTVGGWLGFSQGGVASGPTSGYPAILHGTEAVVPLSGGRSIPVEMKGGGGGGSTFNMTFNLSGLTDRTDKRQLAREIGNMVQQEVARSIGGSTMARRY